MAGEVNWKAKYTELKAKFMESVDMAFRLGFEQGAQQAQQDQMQQQQMQQQQLQQAALQGAANGAPGGQPGAPGAEDNGGFSDQEDPSASVPAGPGKGIEPADEQPQAGMDSQHPDGSELDQHIAKLESMLGKSEGLDANVLKETVNDLKSMQKSFREQLELKKSAAAIPAIAKALHKPQFKMSVQASHNMSSNAKTAVTMQHKIVEDIMNKWEAEEKRASGDILSQLNIEGLTKKEE